MATTNQDAYSERQSQELDQLEQAAREAGRTAKENLLVGESELTEDGIVTFATELAHMYIQKHLERLDTEDNASYMQHYLRFFRVGYKETKRTLRNVTQSGRVY